MLSAAVQISSFIIYICCQRLVMSVLLTGMKSNVGLFAEKIELATAMTHLIF
jgi:hypothetical protein